MHRFIPLGWFAGLVRRTWIFTAATVATCAAFAAHAATALVTADYLLPSPGPGWSPPPPSTPVRPRASPDGNQLVDRNIFCSSCGPAGATAPAGVPPPAVLIATDLGGEARATLRVLATDVQGSWGVGEAIPGLGQLDRIGPMWIEVVDGAGRRGRLSLVDAVGGGPGDPVPDRAPAQPWAGRITRLGEQDYDVDRALVRELVSAGGQQGGVRMIPLFEQGQIQGVRLGAVRQDSIPFALGLKNGDILTAIDGAPLKTLDQLLDLYARLDQLSAIELTGTRRGQPLVRTLRLH